MPGAPVAVAMGVEEDYGAGKYVVMVNYIREVDHCFVAFVLGNGETVAGRFRLVHVIESPLPAGEVVSFALCKWG